jgi:hypothetical protein
VLVIALLAMVLLTALGMSLTLMTSTEARVSAVYRDGLEALYAVDAAVERAIADLATEPDINRLLTGLVASAFNDGRPGWRTWPDGTSVDLRQLTAMVSCGQIVCSDADLDAYSEERPWGRNNPRWQLYAYGPLANLAPDVAGSSRVYVVVWIADDPSENDGQPLLDGEMGEGENIGRGRLSVLAHGYGSAGARRVIEATVARNGTRARILSWREIR